MKAQTVSVRKPVHLPLPMDNTALSIAILLILIFSKYIYMASLTSYYTFYLIHKFNVSVLGGWVFALFGLAASGLIGSLITSTVGAILVLWIASLFSKSK